MSFNWFANKVRDTSLPQGHRLSRLRSCILRLSWLTGERRSQTLARYDQRFHLLRKDFTEEGLIGCLKAIEQERAIILSRLEDFAQRRIQEKREGKRTLSKADNAQLDAIFSPPLTPE
jgi:hypothetical protein